MAGRILLLLCLICFAPIAIPGCSAAGKFSPVRANTQNGTPQSIDPQQVQATTMSFATRYVVAMADVYDRVAGNAPTPAARTLAMQGKLLAGTGAMGNAVDPSPIVGFMDMAVMVTLTRESMQDPWAQEAFGPENSTLIVEVLKVQEANIWSLANNYLTSDEIQELRTLADRWRREHPEQRDVGGARLADFPEAKQSNASNVNLATSIFGLVKLDPFSGLDPAVAQIEESRILAERMFFYLQNMPSLLSWQTDLLYTQMLAQPQVGQLLKDTTTVSTNSTDFTHATTQFADATTAFAKSIETFRSQLPDQQATLVKQTNDMLAAQSDAALKQATANIATLRDTTVQQLNDLVATQRDGALKQAATEIAAQRDAAIKQLDSTVATQRDAAIKQLDSTITTQQDAIAKNLQGILDTSINQLYARIRALILIAATALLAVLLIHRLIARQWPTRKSRP